VIGSIARFAQDAVLLGGSSLLGFAALETWIHSRAGMHMHWWMCLEGPVHRNAVPILLALAIPSFGESTAIVREYRAATASVVTLPT
jgi:hypothetical protein